MYKYSFFIAVSQWFRFTRSISLEFCAGMSVWIASYVPGPKWLIVFMFVVWKWKRDPIKILLFWARECGVERQ